VQLARIQHHLVRVGDDFVGREPEQPDVRAVRLSIV
jgi:hypothetical protein